MSSSCRAAVLCLSMALLASVASATPYAGPCGFTDPNDPQSYIGAIETIMPLANRGIPAVVKISIDQTLITVTLLFAPDFTPVDGNTMIQFQLVESKLVADAILATNGTKCDPQLNSLFFFVKWNAPQALSTLPNGDGKVPPIAQFSTENGFHRVDITFTYIDKKLPWWYINPSAVCLHSKPGGAQLIVHVFDKSKVDPHKANGTCDDIIKVSQSSVLPFNFTCICPPPSPFK